MAPATGSPSQPSISLGDQDPQSSPSHPQAPPTCPFPASPPDLVSLMAQVHELSENNATSQHQMQQMYVAQQIMQ